MHQQRITILGDGHLGWAVAAAAADRGLRTPVLGRPPGTRHDAASFDRTDLVVDATVAAAVARNVDAALEAGVRRFVIATTGWSDDRDAVDAALHAAEASAVATSNFSLGVALFGRLVEAATDLFGAVDGFDPYLLEWHRRGKVDRPSGTALDLGGAWSTGIRPSVRSATSRSCRSAPARHPGCIWSDSTRSASPWNCA
jgi:4-hydroxy-tetrahydrodipicolinate reductase